MTVVFDARSATMTRVTGWERYTQALATRLARVPDVRVSERVVSGRASRLASDVGMLTKRAGRDLYHFPTFPPLPGFRPRFVLTVHDLTFWKLPETSNWAGLHYYRPLLERAIPRADHVVTHSRAIAREVVDYFGIDSSKVTPVYCGADSLTNVQSVPVVSERPYLLAVGTVEPRKNLHTMATGFALSGLGRDYDMLIAGRVGWSSPPPGVRLLGHVTDGELKGLYESASAVVVPSLYEGFGLPLIEAMAHSRRVICSDIEVFREIAEETVEYFDPLSAEAIGEAMRNSVASESEKSHEMVSVASRYTWDRVAENLVAVYRGLW